MMSKTAKKNYIEEMKKNFSSNESVMIAQYQGLNVNELDELRKQLREKGILFKVTKNRIARIALKDTKYQHMDSMFKGPTAIGSSNDPVMAAKILVDYAKENEKLVIIGGGLEDKALSRIDVEALAKLPSLNDLRGKLVGLLQAPASKILRLSVEPASQVLRTISQKSKQ